MPIFIAVGVAAIALVAIGAVFLVGGSSGASQDHAERRDAVASLALSPENATTGIAVGNRVPDFDIRLNNGNIVSTASIAENGQPTFYFFFATW